MHRTTIARLWNRFNTTGSTDDRPRPGQRRATTPHQDRYIRCFHTRERFWFATITAQTLPGRGTKSKASIQRTNIDCQSQAKTFILGTKSSPLASKSVEQRFIH